MNENYFPIDETEYYYYFQIEKFEKAKAKNLERIQFINEKKDILSLTKDELNLFNNNCNKLNEYFEIIILQKNINTYNDFYHRNQTCILLNCSIEDFLLDKIRNLRNIKKSRDFFFYKITCVSSIINPQSDIVSVFLNHFSLIISIFVLLAYVPLYYLIQIDLPFYFVLLIVFLYIFLTIIVFKLIDKYLWITQKCKSEQIKYQLTYNHKLKNKDYLQRVFEQRVIGDKDKN